VVILFVQISQMETHLHENKHYARHKQVEMLNQDNDNQDESCNVPISRTNTSIIKRKKHDDFFFCRVHTRFTEISAEFPLCQEVPSYRQTTCTYLLFIIHYSITSQTF
jgi:hypothetical protein